LIDKDSSLVAIGAKAFAKCASLRSFDVPPRVGNIGGSCFNRCTCLFRLKFASSESLKRVVGDRSLDDALEEFGLSSGVIKIEVEDGGVEVKFPGWVSLPFGKGDLDLTLVRDIQ
jgi:hypothetical protein